MWKMLEQNGKMYATDCYKIYGDVNEECGIGYLVEWWNERDYECIKWLVQKILNTSCLMYIVKIARNGYNFKNKQTDALFWWKQKKKCSEVDEDS